MQQTITAKLKLQTTPDQFTALRATQLAHRDALNTISRYAFAHGRRSNGRWFRDGSIQGYQAPSGTIIVTEREPAQAVQRVAIYARVSSSQQRENLERQAERLSHYCMVRGYPVTLVVKEIASGVNDRRPKLLSLLKDTTITRIVVEHRDRLTRFGFHYLDVLFSVQGRVIEVVNPAHNDTEELLADLTSIIYSFCARLYGQRRAKRTTQRLVRELQAKEEG